MKEQKDIGAKISVVSSLQMSKVQEQTKSLKHLLSTVSVGLHRNIAALDKLKKQTSQVRVCYCSKFAEKILFNSKPFVIHLLSFITFNSKQLSQDCFLQRFWELSSLEARLILIIKFQNSKA